MTYEQGFVDGTACYADLVNKLRAEIERLQSLLKEARQYVSDAGSHEEPGEHQQVLLSDIDAVFKR